MSTKKEPAGSKLPLSTSKAPGASASLRPGSSSLRPGSSSLRPGSSSLRPGSFSLRPDPSPLRNGVSSSYVSEAPRATSTVSGSKMTGQSIVQEPSMPPPDYRTEVPQSMITIGSMVKGSRLSSSMKPQTFSGSKSHHPLIHAVPHCPVCPGHHDDESYQEPSITKQPITSQRPSTYRPSSRPTQQSIMASRLDAASTMASRLDTASSFKSVAPFTAKSVLQTPDDFKFASRQTQRGSLAPRDLKEQDDWAQRMIKLVGVCPENNDWARKENPGGFQCLGGGHGMTDELLAEGLGGILAHPARKWGESKGPYYPDPSTGKYTRGL
jgi:hypothetical protein